jgi:hypothetical protein
MESVRKDIEDVYGQLKGCFRLLKLHFYYIRSQRLIMWC